MLTVDSIEKSYSSSGFFAAKPRQVLNNVSFSCGEGECLGIIGESGSGKSTLGRIILGLEKPDSGAVLIDGNNVLHRKEREGAISAVFQNYKSSINPYFTVEKAIMEPQTERMSRQALEHLLRQVGLDPSYRKKYPHELSGGEVQRVCIARAISTKPKYIVLDEAISSLDVSIQFQILNLLKELKDVYSTSYVFITHDIQAAAYICDRVIIFRNGQIEEMVDIELLKDVQSEYAKKLLQMCIML